MGFLDRVIAYNKRRADTSAIKVKNPVVVVLAVMLAPVALVLSLLPLFFIIRAAGFQFESPLQNAADVAQANMFSDDVNQLTLAELPISSQSGDYVIIFNASDSQFPNSLCESRSPRSLDGIGCETFRQIDISRARRGELSEAQLDQKGWVSEAGGKVGVCLVNAPTFSSSFGTTKNCAISER